MPRTGTVDPIIESVIKVLRDEMGIKRLGAVGYCFGGKYVCRWLREGESKVDVGFVAHPSFVDAEEVEAVQGPLSIAAAGRFSLILGVKSSPAHGLAWFGLMCRLV